MTERLFFALWPDLACRRGLQSLMQGLPRHGGREPHPEDLHLTLVFLGDCAPAARACAEAVAAAIQGTPFDLVFDQVGYWPRPQILWCAPGVVPAALTGLVAALHQGLQRCGFEPERRPYVPHLTLARRARPVPACGLASSLLWVAREFVLVRSDLQTTPHYQVVGHWPLRD